MSKRKHEDGAAAVEFALLVSIFVTLLFGIIDYGLYFNDSISTRNGVREAARQGVVSTWSTATACNSGDSLVRVKCQAKQNIGALHGTATAKVYVQDGTWTKGKALVVCAKVTGSAVIGLVPTPSETRSRVEMAIENESVTPTGVMTTQDSGDWSWC
jgi:Flp pilus assembly protein TadG